LCDAESSPCSRDGSSPDAKLLKSISYFTAYRYLREHGQKLWQPRYFGCILRAAEDFQAVAVYIWNNPVRAWMGD